MKTLKLRWEETKELWSDVRQVEFEASYIEPLEPQVRLTLDRLRRLAQVFGQAYQECT
jgi:hypothetical protein